MPITVLATGLIAEAPVQVLTDDGAVTVFVLDPYPTEEASQVVHVCEVRCRDSRVGDWLLEQAAIGVIRWR